jgi:hypothetical protein
VSLAAYPHEPYYDPARPAWLPYWINSFVEEATRDRLAAEDASRIYPPPPMPAAPTVPPGGYTGAVTDPRAVDIVIRGTKAEQNEQIRRFFSDLGSQIKREQDETRNITKQNFDLDFWLVIGLAAGGALLLYAPRGGRR